MVPHNPSIFPIATDMRLEGVIFNQPSSIHKYRLKSHAWNVTYALIFDFDTSTPFQNASNHLLNEDQVFCGI